MTEPTLTVRAHVALMRKALAERDRENRADRNKATHLEDAVADLVLLIKGTLDQTLPVGELQGKTDAILQRIVPHLDTRILDELEGGDRVVRGYEQDRFRVFGRGGKP